MEIGLVVLWLAAFLALGFVALPLAAWLLPETEHTAFAIPIALAVVAVIGHLVGHAAFGWPAVAAGLVTLGGLSLFANSRVDTAIDPRRAGEYTLVFTAGFALVVLIRSVDPSAAPLPVAIGEKFLDFGLLNALDRSSSLPPESMWFAGETVQYYYGGHMLSSLLATLTGTATEYAYNLALAGFYATLLTAAYGLAASIARPYDVPRQTAGMLGAFFVGIAGNLDTFVRLVAWQLPERGAEWIAATLGLERDVAQWTPGDFYYFDATRIVPVYPDDPGSDFLAATEFPLFAWLNGDLHAHMMSQPFMLLTAALLLSYWHAPAEHRRILLVGFLPPLAGLVGFVNLWSLPTVLGLTALTVLFAPGDPAKLVPDSLGFRNVLGKQESWMLEEGRRLAFALGASVVVLVGGVVWTAPFWTEVVLGGPEQSVEYWSSWTPLVPMVVVLGAFLAVIAAYFGRALANELGYPHPAPLVVAGFGLVGVTAALGFPALGVTVPPILLGWWLLRRGDVGFEMLLVVAGAGLVLLVELVTLDGERFNVVFKPYVHVWLFWAVGTAVVLPRLTSGWPDVDGLDRSRLERTGAALTVVVLVVTVPYAGFAIPGHVVDGTETTDAVGTTLDATAYVEVHYPEEAAAIQWLDGQPGKPTIVTAENANYWWDYDRNEGASAPASLTGIPTVAGWTHERQYRGEAVYDERAADVATIYAGDPDRQAELLETYDVEYVYVGPVESDRYDVTVDRLDGVTVAEFWEHVTIYEVDQNQVQ